MHDPVAFERAGFTVRIKSHDDLASYIDVMHEGRFAPFMRELGGFAAHELDEFLDGIVRYAQFFMAHFKADKTPIPLSGMLAQYCLYRKLRGVPDRAEILEIGPGSGLGAFFISMYSGIQRYDQIENSEAFYLLQSLIGRYLHGHRFLDHAQIDAAAAGHGTLKLDRVQATHGKILEHSKKTYSISTERNPFTEHFPWWKVGNVLDRKYDIVT